MKTAEERKQMAAKGGRARAANMSKVRLAEIGSLGGKMKRGAEFKATHQGLLTIGEKILECHVLDDGRRLLTQTAFFEALGRPARGTLAKDKKTSTISKHIEGLILADDSVLTETGFMSSNTDMLKEGPPPPFLDAENLKPYVSQALHARYCPVTFLTLKGNLAQGYEATLLPEVCEVYLKARDAGILKGRQAEIAVLCEALGRALMKTGIIALIDEATGYQHDRARDALQLLLKAYIGDELLKATRIFPHEFLQGAYRLCGWEYCEGVPIKPHLLGTFINRTIYNKLPPEVLAEIKQLNPVRDTTKRRKHRQWQFLTETTGIPQLDKLFIIASALMRLFKNREEFYAAYDKVVPDPPRLLEAVAEP